MHTLNNEKLESISGGNSIIIPRHITFNLIIKGIWELGNNFGCYLRSNLQ